MKYIFLLVFLSSIVMSCSKKEDPIERERKEMKEFFDNSELLVTYKGVKIALRVDYADRSKKNVKISEAGLKTLSAIATLLTTDTIDVSLGGMYAAYQNIKALYALKKEINGINEDDLPTILNRLSVMEQAFTRSSALSSSIEKDLFGKYNNSTEHFVLGSLWFVTHGAPPDIYTYEAAQIDSKEITKADMHLFSSLLKALVCSDKEWYYTSEASSTDYIDYINASKKDVLDATKYLDSVPNADPEKRFYELRSLGYAMRGYAKDKSGRTDEANKDYELFVNDFEKADLNNKEMCFMSAYICIKNNKNDQAERFLVKMEKSNTYNERDKQTVAELRAFIKDKNGEEFNKYFDHFSLSKIVFMYMYDVSVNSDMAKQLQKNDYSKKLVQIPEKVNKGINYSESMMNTDSLANKAKDLVEGLFK